MIPPMVAQQEEEKKRKRELLAGGAATAVGGGAMLAAKPLVTGRTRLYHGTTEDMAQKIRAEGLRPRSATGVSGVTDILGDSIKSKARTQAYMTGSATEARMYAHQADSLKDFFAANPNATRNDVRFHVGQVQQDPAAARRAFNPFSRKGVVSADVPLWKQEIASKLRKNPEAGNSFKEFINRLYTENPHLSAHPAGKAAIWAQGAMSYPGLKAARVFEGGLGNEYIHGSPNYKKLGLGEIGEYARAKPGRFAAGAATAIGGTALAGYGVKKLIDARKRRLKARTMRKAAMWNGFYSELEKISSDERMEKFSAAFFEKHAKRLSKEEKHHGVGGAIAGGVGGGLLALPIGSKKSISEAAAAKDKVKDIFSRMESRMKDIGARSDRYRNAVPRGSEARWDRIGKMQARVYRLMQQAGEKAGKESGKTVAEATGKIVRRHGLAAAGGALAGGIIGQQIHKHRQKRKAELSKISSVGETAMQVLKHPALRHFAAGAIPGAVVGATAAKKGKRVKGALKGGAIGGSLSLAGGHVYNRAKRDYEVVGRAAQEHGFGLKDMKTAPKDVADKVYARAQKLKETTPIYKTSSKKEDDGWDRPSDSVWHKHKKKIIGGTLAAATAAGVGHHLLTRKHPPKPGSNIPKSIWDEFKIRRAAKKKVKLTTEPFQDSGNLRGFKDGKRHEIKEVKVHNRHRGHEESLSAAIGGEPVVGAGRTAHAEGHGSGKKVLYFERLGSDVGSHSPTKRPPEDPATIAARVKRVEELKKERNAVP